MNNWGSLEHLVWKNLVTCGLQGSSHFVLAVSGGLDSMALLQLMLRVKPQAHFKVVYYHHGPIENANIVKFRDSCEQIVREKVLSFNSAQIEFVTEKSAKLLKGEDDFRKARWGFINSLKTQSNVVVTAHHVDDRLETILLKLIRGSSLEGVSSFKMWNGQVFRPLLESTKQDLLNYAQTEELTWAEDPSNQDTAYLRNWVRETWLVELEKKVAGGRANLGHSLFKIIEATGRGQTFEQFFEENATEDVLKRQWYSLLSPHDQTRALALFLKRHKIYEFSSGQLEEIRKRLDKNQKDLTFEMLGRKWVINATQIVLDF
jgi:tRNA(Ile)-lysidine synthase